MKIRGWVYVISNDSMPDLVKVGYSTKDSKARAVELSGTGSPTPFRVRYDALVFEPRSIEGKVHAKLSSFRAGKEWFRCPPTIAINAIKEIAHADLLQESFDDAGLRSSTRTESGSVGDRLLKGECSYCGHTFTAVLSANDFTVRCPKCLMASKLLRFLA
jgi:hypothetical protein